MKVEDLKEFLFDNSYEEYTAQFHDAIVMFRTVIPDLVGRNPIYYENHFGMAENQ